LAKLQILDDYYDKFLDGNKPNFCYTGIEGPEENIIRFNNIDPYDNVRYFGSTIKSNEETYLWDIQLQNCGINKKYEKNKVGELTRDIEDKMNDIYFKKGDRPEVKHYPPFKYVPGYYDKFQVK